MTNALLSFLFLGHCSHTDLFRDFLTRTGEGVVTDDPELADAVCVFERDASRHAALALPHLQAGRPVFVEKPMALDVASARRLTEAGRVTSFSTLRWAPEVGLVRNVQALRIEGPARETDPSGWGFYAVQ